MKHDDLHKAEALGRLDTMTESLEAALPVSTEQLDETVYDNPADFDLAVGGAEIEGIKHLFVSQRLLQHITKKKNQKSATYKGVRLYLAGAKNELDIEDEMSAEAYVNYAHTKAQQHR